MNIKTSHLFKWILKIVGFLLVWLFLSNYSSKHHPSDISDYQSEIFADKSGYYIYFPATFIYGYHASDFPDSIDNKMGKGFLLDTVSNKMFTKYSSGVAIITTPFFLATHFYQIILDEPASGYTEPYYRTANYAAVFYLLIGIIFLFNYLKNFYRTRSVVIALIIVFGATHLFYYSLIETFMSHVYSFSLFSILIWTMNKYLTNQKLKYVFLLGVLIGLIILIRPINVLFFVPILFLNINSIKDLKNHFYLIFQLKNVLIVLLMVLLIFNAYPQVSPIERKLFT